MNLKRNFLDLKQFIKAPYPFCFQFTIGNQIKMQISYQLFTIPCYKIWYYPVYVESHKSQVTRNNNIIKHLYGLLQCLHRDLMSCDISIFRQQLNGFKRLEKIFIKQCCRCMYVPLKTWFEIEIFVQIHTSVY